VPVNRHSRLSCFPILHAVLLIAEQRQAHVLPLVVCIHIWRHHCCTRGVLLRLSCACADITTIIIPPDLPLEEIAK
jgi:hypothetical protein